MEPRLLHTIPQIEYEKLLVERDTLQAELQCEAQAREALFAERDALKARG